MPFNVGDVVRVRRNDLLRGAGETARVMQVLPQRVDRVREYVATRDNVPDSDPSRFAVRRARGWRDLQRALARPAKPEEPLVPIVRAGGNDGDCRCFGLRLPVCAVW